MINSASKTLHCPIHILPLIPCEKSDSEYFRDGASRTKGRLDIHHVASAQPTYLPLDRFIRVSDLNEDGDLLVETGVGTLEEREARMMASTRAMRRDLAPIAEIRVIQEIGSNIGQVYERVGLVSRGASRVRVENR